jgi:hypothetical protein
LDDIQQFYRERIVIEKEYSAKLTALAKKYHEKKARKTGSLSVGDTPSLTPGSLERYRSLGTRQNSELICLMQRIPYDLDHTALNAREARS